MADPHDGSDTIPGFRRIARAIQLLIDPADGVIVDASLGACEFYGYARHELVGKCVAALGTLASQELLVHLAQAAAATSHVVELRQRLASGELRDVEAHLEPVQGRGRALLHAILRDVSERRCAEEALRLQVTAFAAAIDGMAVLGTDKRYLYVNEALARIHGYAQPEELLGIDWRALYESEEAHRIATRALPELRSSGRWHGEAVGRRRDGSRFDQELSLSLLLDGRLVCVVRDVSERKHAERVQAALYRISDLAHSAAHIDELYAGVHAVVSELMYARNCYIALYDREADRLSFPYFVDEVDTPPTPQPLGRSLTAHVLRTGEPLLADPATFAHLLREGQVDCVGADSVDWLGVPLRHGDEAIGVLVVQSYRHEARYTADDRDLLTYVAQHVAAAIDRQRASDALRESEARFRTLAHTAPCAIFIFRGGHIVYANDACAEITGRTQEELLALPLWELPAPEFRDHVRGRLLQVQRGGAPLKRFEFRLLRPDGAERWLDYSGGTIEYEGRPAVVGVAFDVTERKRGEEQTRRLAYHDALTGLPNRLLFQDRLSVAVAQAHRHGRRLALLFLDLDGFKAVNDSLGHALGDRLLRVMAERLSSVVREGDTVARLAGDEFVLLLPGVMRAVDAMRVGQKVIEALRRPIDLKGHAVAVTASIGISLYPTDGTDGETLLQNADAAMYRAKQIGRDGYQLYAPVMNPDALERLALEQDLRQARPRGELELHYQPVFARRSGRVVEIEALLRWRRPHGLVPVAEFVSLAETSGLLAAIGPWTLEQACARVRELQRFEPELTVTVNLSARQLQQADLAEQVGEALRASGLAPHALRLDLTETALEACADGGLEALRRLKAVGVGLTLDDFGVGPASLRNLRRVPVDALKIDSTLVQGALTNADQAALVSAIIHVAHALRLRVTAEGVETEEQRAFLAKHGCDHMQGHLFSGPLPVDELVELLEKAAVPAH